MLPESIFDNSACEATRSEMFTVLSRFAVLSRNECLLEMLFVVNCSCDEPRNIQQHLLLNFIAMFRTLSVFF